MGTVWIFTVFIMCIEVYVRELRLDSQPAVYIRYSGSPSYIKGTCKTMYNVEDYVAFKKRAVRWSSC